jgi:predicted transcriptional regulator
MPKINPQKKVENLFRKLRVVTMSDLCEVIGSSSRMTVFRRLCKIEYVSSYTHAGRYYTLYDIARFDSDGIWFYDDIGFSQNGSLKNTAAYLVDNADAGKFHFDLERQLRVRVHNVLLDLVKSEQIKRTKFEGQYLYLSSDKARSTKQLEQRDQLSMQARRVPVFISEPIVIEILAEVIRQSKRHPRADQVASALAMRGLPIAQKDVMTVFDHYDIEKKTPDSH